MTRPAFGKTWWGQQWLAALTHIDFDNRLPRGRSYANKGAVSHLSISAGTLQARVKGSRAQPYKVTITVPSFKPHDAERLLDRIASNPVLIARMLNRELDPALLALASTLGIAVFPSRWDDLSMQCSCPDWAVPCKHLAAVIYLLSREIDGNPFLVFSLRGLDLVAALKRRNIDIGNRAAAALPTVAELLGSAESGNTQETSPLDGLDFAVIPDLAGSLLHVLPANPTFFSTGDFRETLGRLMARVAKSARLLLNGTATGEPLLFAAEDHPVLVLDEKLAVSLSGLEKIAAWPDLVSALEALDPAQLPDSSPSWRRSIPCASWPCICSLAARSFPRSSRSANARSACAGYRPRSTRLSATS
jgi:uncharacterized Zn finger protein